MYHWQVVRRKIRVVSALILIVCYWNRVQGYSFRGCQTGEYRLSLDSPWCGKSFGNCQWNYSSDHKIILNNHSGHKTSQSYALLIATMELDASDKTKHCVKLENFVSYNNIHRFHIYIYVNGNAEYRMKEPVPSSLPNGKGVAICSENENIASIGFTLNASCVDLVQMSYIKNLHVTTWTAPPSVAPTVNQNTPTQIGDIQYVGVVVGAICIALFTLFSCLTIISARRSSAREIRRRETHNVSCNEQDDRPDVVAENAPPSYDAVMACPDMYPTTPLGTPTGTPNATPHLSLHRRVLLNQAAGSTQGSPQSQRRSISPTTSEVWDEDQDPPPPYPGLMRTSRPSHHQDNDTNGERPQQETSPGVTTVEERPQETEPTVDNGPWVLNTTYQDLNPRGNNPDYATTEQSRNSLQSIPLGPRLAEQDSGNSNSSVNTSSEQSDDVIENNVQLNNSRNTREVTPKSIRPVGNSIPQLTVV